MFSPDSQEFFSVRTSLVDDTFVIALDGELDLSTVPDVEHALLAAEATDATRIVLDLTSLRFIDSTGINLIMRAQERSRADAGRLALVRGPEPVQAVFDLCGLTEHLPFVD